MELEDFVDGLGFAEAPRWHEGRLWVSDIIARRVLRIDPRTGQVDTVFETPGEPSGLGWLPDGSLLVVQMAEHEVLRWHRGSLSRHGSTTPFSRVRLNDMVVDARGRAWASNLGFDYEREPPCPTHLVGLTPAGEAHAAASGLWCPNGMAISPGGDRLYVGQSAAPELLEFPILPDGSLGAPAVFARLPAGVACDGLCLDVEEALWIASPTTCEFLRISRGGAISARVPTGPRPAIACVLGGEERRTLFGITAATTSLHAASGTREGRIGRLRVDVPGAGIP